MSCAVEPTCEEGLPCTSCRCVDCKTYFRSFNRKVIKKRKQRKEDAAWRILQCWRRNKTRYAEQKSMLFRQWNVGKVDECHICMDSHRVAVLPCGHGIGLRCIRRWCHQEDVRAADCEETPKHTCPTCRASIK